MSRISQASFFVSTFDAFVTNVIITAAWQADNWCFERILTEFPFFYINKLTLQTVRTSQFSLNNEKPCFIY